jgi:hypothetical protein
VGVLAVYVDKILTDFAQLRDRGGRAIDVGAAASLRINHSAQDEFVARVQIMLGEPWLQCSGGIENRADLGALSTLAQDRYIGTLSQGKRKRIDQNGFPRTCFAREHCKARRKIDIGLGDNDKVTNLQRTEHGR